MRLKHEVSAGANTVMKCFNPKYFTSCTCYLHSREVIQSQLFMFCPLYSSDVLYFSSYWASVSRSSSQTLVSATFGAWWSGLSGARLLATARPVPVYLLDPGMVWSMDVDSSHLGYGHYIRGADLI